MLCGKYASFVLFRFFNLSQPYAAHDLSDAASDARAPQQQQQMLSVKVTLEWQPSIRIEYHVSEKR